jgi:AbrB family looped-hinge helix DNA binding protein
MEIVSVSSKFQVVIPRSIRRTLHLKAGTRLQAIVYGDRIELIPVRTPKEMCGVLAGVDTTVERDEDRV